MADGDVRYDGRVVLVTGAGRGLGRAGALLLAARGASVVVADSGVAMDGSSGGPGPANEVVERIVSAGGRARAFTDDLATEKGSRSAVAMALDTFGRIDGVLHGATTIPAITAPDRIVSHELDLVMRINAYAGLWLAKAAWPHMVAQRHGRMVFTTSAAIYGAGGNAAYAAAKAAVIGLARCLAVDGAADNLLVNVISPSAQTRATADLPRSAYADWLLRTMPAEKVAVVAAYLMSEQCSVTGEIFATGGGRVARMSLTEAEGVIGDGTTIEEVRDLMPRVLADGSAFQPRNLSERSAQVAALFGFTEEPAR